MKRKVTVPDKQTIEKTQRPPRERRTLGLRFELVTGETVSGLR